MLDFKALDDIHEYITSGKLEDEFLYTVDERRYEILEYLEKIMDISEDADKLASKLIYRGSNLAAMAGLQMEDKENG